MFPRGCEDAVARRRLLCNGGGGYFVCKEEMENLGDTRRSPQCMQYIGTETHNGKTTFASSAV